MEEQQSRPVYMTPEEVAELLRVTDRTVYEWLRSGRLYGVKAGKFWRITQEHLDAFLRKGREESFPEEAKPDTQPVKKRGRRK